MSAKQTIGGLSIRINSQGYYGMVDLHMDDNGITYLVSLFNLLYCTHKQNGATKRTKSTDKKH